MSREAITSDLGGHAAAAQGSRVSALTRTQQKGNSPAATLYAIESGSQTWQRRLKTRQGRKLTSRAAWRAKVSQWASWGLGVPHS